MHDAGVKRVNLIKHTFTPYSIIAMCEYRIDWIPRHIKTIVTSFPCAMSLKDAHCLLEIAVCHPRPSSFRSFAVRMHTQGQPGRSGRVLSGRLRLDTRGAVPDRNNSRFTSTDPQHPEQ